MSLSVILAVEQEFLSSVVFFGLGLGFFLHGLSSFFGMSIGADFPIPVLCSVFLYMNMYACVWCMCFAVVWVVKTSLYQVHLSSRFVNAV